MSDEHLRRIMILGNELSECQQETIFHRDLAVKAQENNVHLRRLLKRCNEILEHAPEFPFYLIAKYNIEDLQDKLAKELKDG